MTDELRAKLEKRLTALDRKESYLLDLAADEEWPKDKLKAKLVEIGTERKQIKQTLETSALVLDRGQQIFRDALALLDDPETLYKRSGEAVRAILNSAFFSRLYVDGRKITGHEPQEPFGAWADAYAVWVEHKNERDHHKYKRGVGNVHTNRSAVLPKEYGADLQTSTAAQTDSLSREGLSTAVMVRERGLEPPRV